jgi:D-glycero-D-manno-heptose 1,7-bisphosphate phosphatase
MSGRPGAFLDRDGTINVDTHHVSRPEDVRLIPGAAEAIRRLNEADIPVVVVTNQGGIARGYFTEADYAAVRDRVTELLAAKGAHVDAVYHCPHYPSVNGPCECRKPGTRHYRMGAEALGIDVAKSLYVGDRITDVEPAGTLGGLGVLVPTGATSDADESAARARFTVAPTLDDAVSLFLSGVAQRG